MDEKAPEAALVAAQTDLQAALGGAVSLWASATTSEGGRRADLLRDKRRIVLSFFRRAGKLPSEVEPADVQRWLGDLEGEGTSLAAGQKTGNGDGRTRKPGRPT
jgi:hypothetical protein